MMNLEELKKLQERIIKINKKLSFYETIIIILYILDIIVMIFTLYSGLIFYICLFLFFFFPYLLGVIIDTRNKQIGEDIKTFKKEFKRIFVIETLKDYFTNINYSEKSSLFEGTIINIMNVNSSKYKTSTNDYITGLYKDISFKQTDVKIEKEDTDGDLKYWRTIFLGKVMTFDFNKSIKTNIRISNKTFPIENKIKSNIKTEDMIFDKKYNIYAEDEHDAFYILTPTFIEKIKLLNGNIMLDFKKNELFVAIYNTNDAFEWDEYKKIDEVQIKENVKKDIQIITDIIDFFGKEDKIWNSTK